MSLKAIIKSVEKLNSAIFSRNYEEIERMLTDPEIPVNVGALGVEAPLSKMYKMEDFRIAQLFLACPRIDWLALTWDRNLWKLEEEYGVAYEAAPAKNVLDYFYYINWNFVKNCASESQHIYERMITELVKCAISDTYDRLLFNTVKSLQPFKIALKYSSNIKAKDEKGRTLLHETSDLEVIKLLLEMGADVNATDEAGMTPLMVQVANNNWEIADLLMKKYGAAPEFTCSNGESVLSQCYPQQHILNFLGLTEVMFVSEIQKGRYTFEHQFLLQIFAKCPHYKQIFESNLPLHLPSLKDCYLSEYVKSLTDQEYLTFMRNLLTSKLPLNFEKSLKNRSELVAKHSNEFLHLASKSDEVLLMEELIATYKAEANSLIDGKTALFVAKESALELLLDKGADPSIKCDGFLFFERKDFLSADKRPFCQFSWLLKLFKKGFDLFQPAETTGKSLIDYVKCKEKVFVKLGLWIKFYFPTGQINSSLFSVTSQGVLDAFAPIDDDKNTILHYIATQFDKSMHSNVLNNVKISDWKRIQNKAGKTPYELVIERDKDFDFGCLITNPQELQSYTADYIQHHGDKLFEKTGGRLVFTALTEASKLNLALARFLVDERGISLHRLVEGQELADKIMKRTSYRENVLLFILERGYPIDLQAFQKIMSYCLLDALKLFLDKCIDFSPFVTYFCEQNNFIVDQAYRLFVKHEKACNATTEGQRTFDLYFFVVCDSIDKLKLFLENGCDARNLIGTGVRPKPLKHKFTLQMWQMLSSFGWHAMDFKLLCLFDSFKAQFPEFISVFNDDFIAKAINYSTLNLKYVFGDKQCCSICKDSYQSDDKILFLECYHIFHYDCIEEYLIDHKACAYCRSRTKFQPPRT